MRLQSRGPDDLVVRDAAPVEAIGDYQLRVVWTAPDPPFGENSAPTILTLHVVPDGSTTPPEPDPDPTSNPPANNPNPTPSATAAFVAPPPPLIPLEEPPSEPPAETAPETTGGDPPGAG